MDGDIRVVARRRPESDEIVFDVTTTGEHGQQHTREWTLREARRE